MAQGDRTPAALTRYRIRTEITERQTCGAHVTAAACVELGDSS